MPLLLLALLFASNVELPQYDAIKGIGRYATAAEYRAARGDRRFVVTRESYESDGLTVFAYVYAPAKPHGRLPVVVFNRGSWTWPQFAGEYLATFHRLGEAGFVVVAPMLRGSGGAEGRDELGGADLDDLLNIPKLLGTLPYADASSVFLYGESRGGMMVYQAMREQFPMRAAAVVGGFTDMAELTAGKFGKAATAIWPDFAEHKEEIERRRSALQWADKLSAPLLIMHGGADQDVPPSQSIALAAKLQALGKPYELVIRNGANHVMTEWRHERDAHAIEWFRRHLAATPAGR
jgi:dipeptidyl aminopeptidase/acylaminoacyl peptidase